MQKVCLFIIGAFFSNSVCGQDIVLNNSVNPVRKDSLVKPLDGHYRNTDIENRKVVEYPSLRQVDVAYRKRVWREIDVREKMNEVLASPNARLMDILVNAIQAGELTAYDPTPSKDNPTGDNFEFMPRMTVDEVMARLGGDSVLVEEFNENNEVISSKYESRAFSGENVLKFRIKEDWIFDKQRSVFEPRIVGIAPLIVPMIPGMESVDLTISSEQNTGGDPFDPFAPKDNAVVEKSATIMPVPVVNNEAISIATIDPTPVFWIYFPEARHVFVNKEVMNRHNASTGLSFDDIFVKRIFTSYIVKQDNPQDLRVKDYVVNDIDRLYEADRIKKSIMDWEQDLWSY